MRPKVKIVGVVGSPHRFGNTTIAMEEALNTAAGLGAETELIHLLDYRINPCRGCSHCGGACVQDDGMAEIGAKLTGSDGFLVGSPVYFGTMTSNLKTFIDRTRILRHNNFQLANKPFGAISVAGRRNGGQETTLLEIMIAFLRHGVIIVNNGPGTSQYGGTVWAGPIGEIAEDFWGLETCRGVARRVTEVAQIMKAGKEVLGFREEYLFSSTQGSYRDHLRILKERKQEQIKV
ncbi:MAG: flavodoxin family protein [Syntrophothermus sp.]